MKSWFKVSHNVIDKFDEVIVVMNTTDEKGFLDVSNWGFMFKNYPVNKRTSQDVGQWQLKGTKAARCLI